MQKLIYLAAALWLSGTLSAQLRPTDKTGINVFESPKSDVEFTAPHVSFGASIAMPYIALKQSNNAVTTVASTTDAAKTIANPQTLFKNSPNFALSQANLYINSYLADGVTLNLTLYLASKHHNETWVKGGYLQFDKVPFLKWDLLNKIMQYTTVKLGQMEVNYGDAHFRRSDGGNAIYNPFMENYIMDEFATEIGIEADVNYNGIVGVAAITNGNLNPNQVYIDTTQAAYNYSNGHHNPCWILKLGYDKQFTDKFRARLTGSVYTTAGSLSNTLFGGDRTGSNYSAVMYNAAPGTSTAFNGRYNPGLTDRLTAFMGNLFLCYKPMDALVVESFTTLESAKGRTAAEKNERTANQFATDVVLRFGQKENFFLGARYNTLSADVAASAKITTVSGSYTYVTQDAMPTYTIKINRFAISGGWFMTKNIMAKVEWVNQKYSDVPNVNYILNGAKFHGLTAEAIISF